MISVEVKGAVRVLRLAHGKANALDLELLEALESALGEAWAGPEQALVLAGGERIFCAGVDLHRVLTEREGYLERFLPALDRVVLALYGSHKPTVAAVQGAAVAGGAILVAACDRRIGASNARIGVPELQLGVPFPLALLAVLREVVPAARQGRVLWSGVMGAGPEAVADGWFDELTDPGAAEERALAVANQLASLDGRAFAWNKAEQRAGLLRRQAEIQPRATAEAIALWTRPDALAAIERYVAATLKKA